MCSGNGDGEVRSPGARRPMARSRVNLLLIAMKWWRAVILYGRCLSSRRYQGGKNCDGKECEERIVEDE